MTTRILLIRHGETAWNRVRRIQGHLDVPLAPTGMAQAQRLAQRLEREARQGERLDAIWSSDLLRAQQTAQPGAARLGLPVRLAPDLRERDYGLFQGLDSDEIAQRFPAAYARWQTRDPDFAPPQGESPRAFYQRALHALGAIVAAHPDARIACVTHGGVLDCAYRFARQRALDAPRDYALLNASVNVIDFEDMDRASVVSWADVSHLASGESDDDGFEKRPSAQAD